VLSSEFVYHKNNLKKKKESKLTGNFDHEWIEQFDKFYPIRRKKYISKLPSYQEKSFIIKDKKNIIIKYFIDQIGSKCLKKEVQVII
jgi:hypothetical protein